MVIDCKGDGGRMIFEITAPAAAAIPRRMVSTSGNSGMEKFYQMLDRKEKSAIIQLEG